MAFMQKRKFLTTAFVILLGIFGYAFLLSGDNVDFNTEVKPLLNKKCISCHGGVKQKGGFSLLFREEALAKGASGRPGIVPGDPEESELIRRLTLTDDDERMPYHEHPLSDEEIDLLRRWVKEGATWGDHWAYVPVREMKVPTEKGFLWGLIPGKKDDWVLNDIDRFIKQKQTENGLSHSKEADKRTILRRLSLDLTGLPASDNIAAFFLRDDRPEAYERLVDTLLSSPQYGERWTALWMDLSRYADSKGYERDDARSIWRYRDWLVKSFNEDKPYDKFLIEQMAGDLLPGATDENLIATAFHRNTMTNDEGGTDNEEFRTAAVIDRVNTTWEVLMGTTFACVQCHSHPYDPFRHEEYFKFMALLNDTRDEDTYAEYPLLHEFKGEDSVKLRVLSEWLTANATANEKEKIIRFLKTRQPAINSLRADSFYNSELSDTKWLVMRKNGVSRLRQVDLTGHNRLLIRFEARGDGGILSIRIDSAKGTEISRLKIPATTGGFNHMEVPISTVGGIHDIHLVYQNPTLTDSNANGIRFDWFHFTKDFPGVGKVGYDSAVSSYRQLLDSRKFTSTPILLDNPEDMHRRTFVFEKGSWLVPGKEVSPDVPSTLPPLPKDAPRNRFGLALWLTGTDNPLTARTMVNRVWEQLFGQGIVETLEDLGTQGIPPTHRELLDHLSWKFMHDHGWSVKKLLKEIVMSATYRQDSKTDEKLRRMDPFNRWYARGPRVRLTAEQVRDQSLAVSGLLSNKMYGPSVMPYQPEGIWQSPYNGQSWNKSSGEDQYRRAIYTHWKRTGPYPSIISFDGSAREVCISRRIRTNTPLQALTLLNDPASLEAARHLSFRLLDRLGNDPGKVIDAAYLRATGRPIGREQKKALEKLYGDAVQRFQKNPAKTCEMTGLQDQYNKPDAAALVVVSNAILNLDEVLTKN